MSDWLDNVESTDVATVAQLTQKAEQLKVLSRRIAAMEEQLTTLKNQYLQQSQVLADEFRMNGATTIVDNEGVAYKVDTISQCSINKNKEDKQRVAEWLRSMGAGHLVKYNFTVIGSQDNKELLQKSGVAFEEVTDMNTNSVKAFVLGALGQKESPAIIQREDLPKGLHLFQYDTVTIKGSYLK